MPDDWRPMTTVGSGGQEIRIHTQTEQRVIYVATLPEAIYVLHAFEKRTRRTRSKDIAIARRRLAAVRAGRGRS